MKILEYKKPEITNSYNLETPLLIFLKELSLIIVEGENSFKFLQGQFTINMLDLSENKYLFSAHCNYIGKVLSILIVFRYLHGYAYIQRSSVSEFHIQEIKKYAIFSNIDIYQNNKYYLFGVIGSQSRSVLKKIFRCLPNKENNLVQERLGLYILRIEQPLERFIIVISLDNWNILKKKDIQLF
ncbi:hypothetical protein HIC20_01140 [Buchnera aphidicola (Hormaphis cornu)]|nr:hypothetical protein HIC20_01140 [Buchnera aphidicola (Hormaphis cornu)]